MRVSSASSAGSDSGSAHEAAAGPVGRSPNLPGVNSPRDEALHVGPGALTSWECRQQQALQECTFSPRLNANARKSQSIVAQVWKHGPAHAKSIQSSAALQANTTGYAAAADCIRGTGDDCSPTPSSGADIGRQQAAVMPQFVTAPMHHEAARARHRQLVSYAAATTAAAAAAKRICSVSDPPEIAACSEPECKAQPQQAGTSIASGLSAEEVELQAALQECDKQQQLLQIRRHRKHAKSDAGAVLNPASAGR